MRVFCLFSAQAHSTVFEPQGRKIRDLQPKNAPLVIRQMKKPSI